MRPRFGARVPFALDRLTRWSMRLPDPATGDVPGARGIEAQPPVWSAPYHSTVVLILSVVFPPALIADLVPAALRQGGVAAAWTGVERVVSGRGQGVLLRDVGVEPGDSPTNQFIV
jgi:hypothetical protein